MDRIVELAKLLDAAMERGDIEAAKRYAAEQRAIVDAEYNDRVSKLTADPLPL